MLLSVKVPTDHVMLCISGIWSAVHVLASPAGSWHRLQIRQVRPRFLRHTVCMLLSELFASCTPEARSLASSRPLARSCSFDRSVVAPPVHEAYQLHFATNIYDKDAGEQVKYAELTSCPCLFNYHRSSRFSSSSRCLRQAVEFTFYVLALVSK